jgi:hypothetical protein
MTWKTKVSKANVLLFQLQASVHGIKGNEFGSLERMWRTPTAEGDAGKRGLGKMTTLEAQQKNRTVTLSRQMRDVSQGIIKSPSMYPTPTAGCVEGGEQSSRVEMTESGAFILRKKNKPENTFGAKLSDAMLYLEKMYPTPRASAAMVENMETIAKRNKYNSKLEEKIAMEMYSTPTTNDAKNLTFCQSQKERSSIIGDLMRADKTKHGGKLNPNFVEFLMGFPMNWTKIDPTE